MDKKRECGNCFFYYGATVYEGICDDADGVYRPRVRALDSCCMSHRFLIEVEEKEKRKREGGGSGYI